MPWPQGLVGQTGVKRRSQRDLQPARQAWCGVKIRKRDTPRWETGNGYEQAVCKKGTPAANRRGLGFPGEWGVYMKTTGFCSSPIRGAQLQPLMPSQPGGVGKTVTTPLPPRGTVSWHRRFGKQLGIFYSVRKYVSRSQETIVLFAGGYTGELQGARLGSWRLCSEETTAPEPPVQRQGNG